MINEDTIHNYSKSPYKTPHFRELLNVKEEDIKKYCKWSRNNYQKITPKWDMDLNTLWTAKYYLAVKFIHSSAIFFTSFEYAESVNLKIAIPYLIYYSLLTISRSLILTSPINDKDVNYKRTHDKIIDTTADIIARLNKDKSLEYEKLITTIKVNRELFSYKFPASGLRLIKDLSQDVKKFYDLIYEMAILNSQILDVLLTKIKNKNVFEISDNFNSSFYKLIDYEGKIDNDDYYNINYIDRKIKRPHPLNLMISEGIEEDMYLAWAPDDTNRDYYIPPEFIF